MQQQLMSVLATERLFVAVIPSIEMAAAGLDSIAAIVGYAVCSGISITSGSLVYSILSGPLQVHTAALLACFGSCLSLPVCSAHVRICLSSKLCSLC